MRLVALAKRDKDLYKGVETLSLPRTLIPLVLSRRLSHMYAIHSLRLQLLNEIGRTMACNSPTFRSSVDDYTSVKSYDQRSYHSSELEYHAIHFVLINNWQANTAIARRYTSFRGKAHTAAIIATYQRRFIEFYTSPKRTNPLCVCF